MGHFTDGFVNKQMINRTGLQIIEKCDGPEHVLGGTHSGKSSTEIYFLKCLSPEQYAEKHRIWSDKRGQSGQNKRSLDLSMCPHPLKALQYLQRYDETRCENVTQLDVSDALIKSDEIEEFAAWIYQKLPKLTHILFIKTDQWSIPFAHALNAYFPNLVCVNRLDSPNPETLPPFSVPMARKIKLFHTVPNERLILPTESKQNAPVERMKGMGA